ncbi:MAG: CHASE3 domain-containing protein [Chitinophagaceae bacterium]
MKPKLFYLYILYSVSICILLLLSILFYERLDNLSASTNLVSHTYEVIQQLDKVETNLTTAESNQRGFILSRDSIFYRSYLEAKKNISTGLNNIKYLIIDNNEQQKIFSNLEERINLRSNYFEQTQHLILKDSELILRIQYGKKLMDSCSNIFAKMKTEELNLLNARNKNQQFYERTTPQNFKIIFFFSFAILVISFLLITREFRRRAQYQQQQERKVYELNRMAAELQEFSFIASHNLQEPLRKIQTFSNRLINKHKTHLDEEGKLIINRIDDAAASMHQLINNFVKYTTIANAEEKISGININGIIEEVKEDLQEIITEKNVLFIAEKMRVIYAYPKQLFILFSCLFNNAIYFSKPGISPIIQIFGSKVNWTELPSETTFYKGVFYKINVCDNGIGFDNAFAKKIFKLFQRLNDEKTNNNSRGIGLAIVRQIMINHHGFVTAEGKPGEGACFSLYFPMEKIGEQ